MSDTIIPEAPEPMAQPQQPKSRAGCIALGVGGGCLVVILACGGIIGLGVIGAFAAIKSSEPYSESLRRAQASAELIEELGEPIESGFLVQGNIHLNNNDGNADLNYTVSGPKGTATVNVVGSKKDGVWSYSEMNATPSDGSALIDLAQ